MFKQTIQIFGRIKPTNKTAAVYSVNHKEETGASLEFLVPRDLADGIINHKRENYKFRFRKVFEQHIKQDVIFDEIAKPVAESVLAGYNGTIFAYGQTGSGKTFTITGGAEHYADRGIIPRILSYLYERFNQESSVMYTMHISYLEIYNEVGYDLLDSRCEASRLEDLPKVMIMEDTEQNIHLKNLSMQQSGNVEEALNLLFLGDTNRMIAETPMNQASTRSHCVFTIHLCRREPGSATLRRSKLHLVDLAGSDRVSKTGLDGQLLTEAKYINLSLHYLEQVIIALSEKNRSHIPYRNSMLTSVLRDSLGGNCMTTMIATMAVDKRNLDESISTCRFAQRVALIKNVAILNEELDPTLLIARLRREIQFLNEELAMVTGEQRQEQLTAEEIQKLDELVKAFLNDKDPDVTLSLGPDMRKIQHCFFLMKSMILDKKGAKTGRSDQQLLPTGSREYSQISNSSSAAELTKLNEILKQRDDEISILVKTLKKEKERADDAIARLAYITDANVLPSLKLSSTQPVSQPKETKMETFFKNCGRQGFTRLHLRRGNKTSTRDHSERMFTMPQFRVRKADNSATDHACEPYPVLQNNEGNNETFTEDDSREVSTTPQLEEQNVDTLPTNHREEVCTGRWFSEGNPNSFGVDRESQASTAVQLKVENMVNLPAEDQKVSTVPQFREENMETVPVGRAGQYMKIGSKLSMGKQEAFEIFIRDHEEHQTIEENTNIFKERSDEARRLGEQLKEGRNRITELKKQLQTRRRQRAAHAVTGNDTQDKEENDPLEESLCNQIKQEKVTYNNNIGHLQALRTETEHLQLLIDRVKVKIRKDFQTWWSQEALNLQESESEPEASYSSASQNETLQPSSPGTPGFCAPDLSSTMKESPSKQDTNLDNSVSSAPDLSCLAPIDKLPAPVWSAWNKSQEESKNSYWRNLSTTTLTSSSIPLTGDQEVDSNILAFVMARKNLLSRIGPHKDVKF
ncbi:kinesin-like protein KIF6 isoform X1 [Xiphophorus couchianus]|uniref:kinesin-like protein KIF6 isoform X1 n=1 Tax=Xiphophorus couchianus TaxID=32473 RepID=UPI001015E841|nr:kinesin-like protein KIF6 isoform X1 [Xiphophorus couchianus]